MNSMIHDIMDRKGAPALIALFFLLYLLETFSTLRIRKQNRMRRTVINTLFSVQGFLTLRLLLLPAMVWVAYLNESWQFGLNYLYSIHPWLECLIVFLVLDYLNYWWHVLNHRIPLLWRFHLVHHTDIDLDVTTALRFHGGELVFSVIFRGLAVLVVGASPLQVLVYEVIFEAATQFHHSNLRMPFGVEKLLNRLFVTPRMHGIHHSIIRDETDSNYSVIFSFWDRISGTVNLNIPQRDVVTGVPVYGDPRELTIPYLFKLPFTRIRAWEKHPSPRAQTEKDKLQP